MWTCPEPGGKMDGIAAQGLPNGVDFTSLRGGGIG
jgi:hypothetical protein